MVMKGGGGGGCEGLAKGTVKRKDLAEESCKMSPKTRQDRTNWKGRTCPLMRRRSDKSQGLKADSRIRAKGRITKRQLLKIALGQEPHYCGQRCEPGQEVRGNPVAGLRPGRAVLPAGDGAYQQHI